MLMNQTNDLKTSKYFVGICKECGMLDSDNELEQAIHKATRHMIKKHGVDMLECIEQVEIRTTTRVFPFKPILAGVNTIQ